IGGQVFVDDQHRERTIGTMNGVSRKQQVVAGPVEHGIAWPRKRPKQLLSIEGGIRRVASIEDPVITTGSPAINRRIKIAARRSVVEVPPDIGPKLSLQELAGAVR